MLSWILPFILRIFLQRRIITWYRYLVTLSRILPLKLSLNLIFNLRRQMKRRKNIPQLAQTSSPDSSRGFHCTFFGFLTSVVFRLWTTEIILKKKTDKSILLANLPRKTTRFWLISILSMILVSIVLLSSQKCAFENVFRKL